MARGVDQIQGVLFAFMHVMHLDGVALDRDAFFLLKCHVVQDLVLHLPLRQGSGQLQQTVCQSAFAVVDVGDDAEIPDMAHVRFHRIQR